MSLMMNRLIISSVTVEAERGVSRIVLSKPKIVETSLPGMLPRSAVTTISSMA